MGERKSPSTIFTRKLTNFILRNLGYRMQGLNAAYLCVSKMSSLVNALQNILIKEILYPV